MYFTLTINIWFLYVNLCNADTVLFCEFFIHLTLALVVSSEKGNHCLRKSPTIDGIVVNLAEIFCKSVDCRDITKYRAFNCRVTSFSDAPMSYPPPFQSSKQTLLVLSPLRERTIGLRFNAVKFKGKLTSTIYDKKLTVINEPISNRRPPWEIAAPAVTTFHRAEYYKTINKYF